MTEEQYESLVRSQAMLLINRNPGRPYIIKRIMKRYFKCIDEMLEFSEYNDQYRIPF